MAFEDEQTAIIVAVPEADAVVDRWRKLYDEAARFAVPAHITILYPFLDVTLIDDSVMDRLRELCGEQPAFEFDFHRCGRFPDALYLDPEPADPFWDLTAVIARQWPEAPPYRGAFDTVRPHLTVANGVDEGTLARIENDIITRLPMHAVAEKASLLAFESGRWWPRARLAFG